MKKYLIFHWLCILATALFSCSEDDHGSRNLSIQLVTNNDDKLTEATAYILSGEVVIATYALHGHTTDIPFNGNPDQVYVLRVAKAGYETFSTEFKLSNLREELRGAPLRATLSPALLLTVNSPADDVQYVIDLEGSGIITLTWPDGNQETHSLPLSVGTVLSSGPGYDISIKGDLQNITSFRAFGYAVGISNISGLKHLKSLKSFLPGWVILSERLDLRHNRNLELVDLFEARLPDWFTLPQQHRISSITITLNDRSITSAEIDLLINSIYRNAVRQRIYNGMVALTGSDAPSSEAVDKIKILEEEYGWSINLNL